MFCDLFRFGCVSAVVDLFPREEVGDDEKSHAPLWRDLSLCADKQTYNPFYIWAAPWIPTFVSRISLICFFCYSPLIYFCLGSSFLVQLFVGLEEIIDRTRWWGLPIGDPTLMRTEFTLRSKTFAADGSIFPFSSPPILKLLFCFIDEIVPHCLCYSLFFIDESQIPYVKLQDASEGCGALTTWSNATPRVNTK